MNPAPAASRRRLPHVSSASPAAAVKSLFPAELSPVSDLRLTMEQLGHGSVRAHRGPLLPPRPLTGASGFSASPLGPGAKPARPSPPAYSGEAGRASLAAPAWGSSRFAPLQRTDRKEPFLRAPRVPRSQRRIPAPSTSSPTAPRGPVSPPSNLSPRGFFRSLIPRPRALPAPYLLTEPSMSLSPPPFSPSKLRPPGSQQPPNRSLVIPPTPNGTRGSSFLAAPKSRLCSSRPSSQPYRVSPSPCCSQHLSPPLPPFPPCSPAHTPAHTRCRPIPASPRATIFPHSALAVSSHPAMWALFLLCSLLLLWLPSHSDLLLSPECPAGISPLLLAFRWFLFLYSAL